MSINKDQKSFMNKFKNLFWCICSANRIAILSSFFEKITT